MFGVAANAQTFVLDKNARARLHSSRTHSLLARLKSNYSLDRSVAWLAQGALGGPRVIRWDCVSLRFGSSLSKLYLLAKALFIDLALDAGKS